MGKISRSIDQIIFKHTPGSFIALDDAGMFGVVSRIKGKQDIEVDTNILIKNLQRALKKWEETEEGHVAGFSSSEIEDSTIVAIRPLETVLWDFLPHTLFECTNPDCKLLVDSSEKSFNGVCSECNSKLKQFKFIYFHSCGDVRAFQPIRDTYCPRHGNRYLYLHDTGKFQTSFWRCLKCNHESSIRMPVCPNAQCREMLKQKNERYSLRGAIWKDPWVYFSQVITFVNLKEDQIKPILNSERRNELLISGYIGTVEAGQGRLKNKAIASQQNIYCPKCRSSIPPNSKYCNKCGAVLPTMPESRTINISSNISLDTQSDDSDIAIFSAVRDLERTVSFKDEKKKQETLNDIERVTMLEETLKILKSIGLDDIFLIGDFPITHVAYGYTRHQSKPPSWLRAYPPQDQSDTKIPVYTNCVTTEAWMVQLSATNIIKWININGITRVKLPNSSDNTEAEAKLLLLEIITKEEPDDDEKIIQSIIYELVHSLSHTLLYSLAAESGLDIASFGEILLPKALSFVIYSGESDIGGLSASFYQAASTLLDSFKNELRLCKFDPSCSEDDDGSCVGCLQIPRGCSEFNEKLSRSYIFGGGTKNLSLKNIKVGFVDLNE